MKASEFAEYWRKDIGKCPDGYSGEGPCNPNWVHPTCIAEVNGVADWVAPDFFYSKNQRWQGVGMIGLIGDYILYYTQGDILELGVGTSSLYLSALARKYYRVIYHFDADSAKFVHGVATGKHFNHDANIFLGLTDDLFAKNKLTPLALVLVDACHEYEQAKRDFWNSEQYVVEDGFLLLHDTYPPSEEATKNNMCWDCYKLRQDLEKDRRFDVLSFPNPGQLGFTLVRKKPKVRPYYQE